MKKIIMYILRGAYSGRFIAIHWTTKLWNWNDRINTAAASRYITLGKQKQTKTHSINNYIIVLVVEHFSLFHRCWNLILPSEPIWKRKICDQDKKHKKQKNWKYVETYARDVVGTRIALRRRNGFYVGRDLAHGISNRCWTKIETFQLLHTHLLKQKR